MWLMAQMKACDMPMKKCISLCLPGQVDGHIVVLQHDEAGLWLFNFSELSLVKTTAALVVCLLNKSFKPYTRSKKSMVDFESRRGAGKKKEKHCVITSCLNRTFAERLLPIGHSPVRARFFPIRHLPIIRNRHLPIQTFAYQFRFECSRHVPIRNSTQGTFAYQTIAYQKGIENLKKQTFANLKLFIRRDIRLSDNYLSIASIRKMSWKLSFKLSQLLLVLDLQCCQMWR